jgi:hypothetical protein
MSTKIYNAYEFKGSIQELFVMLNRIRQKYWKECYAILDKYSTTTIADIEKSGIASKRNDKYLIMHKPEDLITRHHSILQDVLDSIIDMGYNNPLNLSASCVVYPVDKPKKRILVQFFGIRDVKKLLGKNYELFKDFHYQNQADKPDKISDAEWDMREKIWDKIFGSCGSPAECGLVFDLVHKSNLFNFCYQYKDWEAIAKEKRR